MRLALGFMAIGLLSVSSLVTAGEHTRDSLDAVKKGMANGKAVLLDVREKSVVTSKTPNFCL